MYRIQLVVAVVFLLLEVAVAKSAISPSYLWPLRFVYNKRVPVVPPLDVHGDVTNDDVGLQFDGKTAWLDAGELGGSCVAEPQKCSNGLSVAMRAKVTILNGTNSTSPQFLFDSGGFNGEGVSIYLKGENLVGEVADKSRFWRASTKLPASKWHFILVTWSSQEGLMLFIDGPMKAQNTQPMSFQLNPVASSNHVIIGRCNAEMGRTFAKFSSDLVAVFDSVTPDGKIYLSYSFSAPSTRGNIRYVNAKFINMADFDLMIFPDRGEHQKEGYQLEAHSSTLLEYVLREGPLPIGMNFRLQNKKNGEQLTYEGKYDFRVVSSDDKQVVKEYRILPDSKITALMTTSAVSINYKIRQATVNIVQQPLSGGAAAIAATEAQSTDEQNALIDNPENPVDEEANATQQVQPAGTGAASEGHADKNPQQQPVTVNNGTEPMAGVNKNGSSSSPGATTTVAPTVPPPPQYATTLAPNATTPTVVNATSTANTTAKPETSGETTVTSPELPDDELKVKLNEAGATATGTNATGTNVTDEKGLLGEIEGQQNETASKLNESIAVNVTDKLNVTTEHVTEKNVTAQNKTEGKNDTETLAQIESVQSNLLKTRPSVEKRPPVANVNTPNPWLNVAKAVQNQQPIKWQNGQGLYHELQQLHNNEPTKIGNQDGIAPVNYNKGKGTNPREKSVWQYLNSEQELSNLLGQNKFRNAGQNTVSISPFKFANRKTQQELQSFYTRNKDSESKNRQTRSVE